jgi:hypothetical protein
MRLTQVFAENEEARALIEHGNLDKLLLKDQLLQIMSTHKVFRGFIEVSLVPY